MARRRFRRRSAARRLSPVRRVSRHRSFGKSGSEMYGLLGAGIYGAVREKVSNMLIPLTSKIPAGEYADEVGMLLANYILGKYIPSVKPVTRAGMLIEAAAIGRQLSSGLIPQLTAGNSTATSSMKVYG